MHPLRHNTHRAPPLLPLLAAAVSLLHPVSAAGGGLDGPLSLIRAVGPEGRGNAEASQAWKTIAAQGPEALPDLLRAMNGASGAAGNWIRGCIDAICERTIKAGQPLPAAKLKSFLLDRGNDARARFLAFELLGRADAAAASALVPGFLDDPAPELRREAVGRLAAEADASLKAGKREDAIRSLQQALASARDAEQIEAVAKSLRDLGQVVDLTRVFGFLTSWKVIGPFDNTGLTGFNQVYPPEQTLDFAAEYDGKEGRVGWKEFTAKDELGTIDLNAPCGKLKEVAGYASTVFESTSAQPVELRLASENAWKLWLNGTLMFARDEYHRGRAIDQYRIPATLQPGPNRILVKVCQDKLVEDWTVEWQFQLRVTDATGAPVFPAAKGGTKP